MQTTPSTTPTASPAEKLLILPTVLERITMSRSGWLQGVKDGRYPAPVRLSPRRVAWRQSDITAFINSLATK